MRQRPASHYLVAAVVLVGLAGVCLPGVRAFRSEWSEYRPARTNPVPLPTPAPKDLAAVSFKAPDGTLVRGWLLPSKNGAAVVFFHGSEADRRALWGEAQLIASRGYGALLIDFPGHGETDGEVHFGDEARGAALAAVRFLAASPGVKAGRIAGFGASMGSYTLAQVAPLEPLLSALVLTGTPTDGDELTRWQFSKLGPLTYLPALLADRLGGFVADPTPLQLMPSIRQPMLIVAGEKDPWVPNEMGSRLARAAGGRAAFLLVPGGHHGDYLEADREGYARALLDFLGRTIGR